VRTFVLQCPNCGVSATVPLTGAPIEWECRWCGSPARVEVFPALLRGPAAGRAAEKLLIPEQSGCYYHPDKEATAVCDSCGRFLCNLCEIELSGRRLCSGCIESAVDKDKSERLRQSRVYYDNVALAFALYPMILVWVTIFTAPIAIYVALRYSRRQLSILPRWRWRFLLAIALAGLQLAGWVVLISFLFTEGAA